MDQNLKNDISKKMTKAMGMLDREFSGLRTGRASVHLLDPVIVEVYGSKMQMSQVGTVSTPDAKTITVQVWDKVMVKAVEKAIANANLGVNPSSDGQLIRMNLPLLSEERRKELVKIAHKYGENTKITLRNVRRDGMDKLKQMEKSNGISKDEHHTYSDEVQKLTDEFIGKVEANVKSKENEIITI
jgi:ribosome recycling factor